MHRDKASQHLVVGGIYDRVGLQSCDVSLPDGYSVFNFRDIADLYNAFFLIPFSQILILYFQNLIRHLFRHADIHQ